MEGREGMVLLVEYTRSFGNVVIRELLRDGLTV